MLYIKPKIRLITNLSVGYLQMQGVNPVFDEKQQNVSLLAREIFYYRITKTNQMSVFLILSATYGTQESNINFFSDRGLLFSGGIYFGFGERTGQNEKKED